MSTLKTNNIQHVDRSDPSIIINTDGSVNIAGTMTYEDVTNVDAVGIITGRSLINAQKQVHVGTGVSVKAGGINVTAGITTVQALQATTGTFSAAVSGTTGTFSGAVSGTTGTFSGAVSGTTGTFSGAVQGTTGTFSAAVSGTTGTFSSAVSGTTGGFSDAVTITNAAPTINLVDSDVSTTATLLGNSGNIFYSTANTNRDHIFRGSTTEAARITGDGNFGVGTNNPSYKTQLSVSDTTAYSDSTISANQFQLAITNSGAAGVAGILLATEPSSGNGGHCGIRALSTGNGDSALTFSTRGSATSAERLRITSAGRVLIGTANDTSHNFTYSWNPKLQFESASTSDYARFSLIYNGNDSVGPGILFGKSRGTSIGSHTLAQQNDQIGGLFFQVADGTDKHCRAATIICYTDGATGGNDTPGRLEFSTTSDGASDSTERLRIAKDGEATFKNKGGGTIKIGGSSAHTSRIVIADNAGSGNGNLLIEGGDGTDFMKFSSGGDILLGSATVNGAGGVGLSIVRASGLPYLQSNTNSTSRIHNYFQYNGTTVGTIQTTTGQTSFNNLSDYRSKENDVKITDGIEKIKLLRPIRFNYKVDKDIICDGFFAHEVTPAVPTAVSGEKDAVDSEGEIDPQMLDTGKIIPLLTAALQEAITEIETLKTKVAALEGS